MNLYFPQMNYFHAPKDAAFSGGSLTTETSRVSQVYSTKQAWHLPLEWQGYLSLQAEQTPCCEHFKDQYFWMDNRKSRERTDP